MAGYTDVVLFRRLLGQARPYWPHVGALFLLGLLASPLSLLAPLPLKIAVDSVIGSHPPPWFIAPFVPEALTRSGGAGPASITASGASRRISLSTSRLRACSARCRKCRNGIW